MKRKKMKPERDRLVTGNMGLVVSMAKKYSKSGLPLEDLIQEGSVGLMTAAEKFDGRKNCKFSTYAVYWIRQAILRAITDQSRTIRIPAHRLEQVNRIKKESSRLMGQLGYEPSDKELAAQLGWTVSRVRQVMDTVREPVSLDAPGGEEENSSLCELTPDRNAEDPADRTEFTLLQEDIQAALASLPPREMTVLKMRFGFDSGYPHTLEEIGSHFNVTRERVRQIEASALRKLRHPSRSRSLRGYLK